jgi:hypothetical protein
VVFLLGTIPFDPGYAATVHFLWPGGENGWKLLGMLSNEKPSAIFRLRGTIISSSSSSNVLNPFGTRLLTANVSSITDLLLLQWFHSEHKQLEQEIYIYQQKYFKIGMMDL